VKTIGASLTSACSDWLKGSILGSASLHRMFSLPTGARQNHYAASAPILAGKPVAPDLSISSFVYGKNSNPVHNSDFASSIGGCCCGGKFFSAR
jgi:hypothetical protein